MWTVEADPLLRSTIVGVAILDGVPDWDRLTERVRTAIAHVPALRQRVTPAPLRPGVLQWIPVDHVDIGYHLRRIALPPPGAMQDLLDLVCADASRAFDRERPLWEFTLVEGLDGDRAAFVTKAHHVVTDGIGAIQLAAHLYDLEPDPAEGPPGASPAGGDGSAAPAELTADVPTFVDRWRDALRRDVETALTATRSQVESAVPRVLRALWNPIGAVGEAVETARSVGRVVAPVFETKSPLMTERRLASRFQALEVPFDALRAAAKAVDGTLNDAFLGAVTGGLRRYHERHGVSVDELRVAMPISLRTEDDAAGGNHLTVLRFSVPVGVDDPSERLAALHEIGSRLRDERSLAHTESIASVLNLLPRGVIGTMLKRVDFLASNVPGVPVPLYLAGVEVSHLYPFGPTAGSSVNFTLMSYRGRCCIGVHSDAGAIADPDVFFDCVVEGFDEVLALAGPPTRRSARSTRSPRRDR